MYFFVAVPVIYIYMAIWRARLQAHILHPGIIAKNNKEKLK